MWVSEEGRWVSEEGGMMAHAGTGFKENMRACIDRWCQHKERHFLLLYSTSGD